MKKIRKMALVILALCICASSLVAVASAKEGTNTYTTIYHQGDTEIRAQEAISQAQINCIVNHLLGKEEETAETYGLMCTIFGHDYETHTVEEVQHNYRASYPRCLKSIYDVKVCSRCEDTNSALLSSSYIGCCS